MRYLIICLLTVVLTGCEQLLLNENSNDYNYADFEKTWETVDEIYPFLEFKQIDWDEVYNQYRPRAEAADGDEIYMVLSDMLALLKDGHVGLRTEGNDYVKVYTPPRTERDKEAFAPLVVRKYFSGPLLLDSNKTLEYGLTDSNVAYLRIATFSNGSWTRSNLRKAIVYLSGAKGLIIDVRNNSGGSSRMVKKVLERILTGPIPDLPVRTSGRWNDPCYIRPSTDGLTFTKPLVMLMNGTCFSATEGFLALATRMERTVLLGDTTAGGSSAPETFPLPSGKRIRISTKYICRPDSTPIEWNGIVPDIRIPQTEQDIREGRDKQLESALEYLEQ